MDERLCSACGKAVPGRAKFCPECGECMPPPRESAGLPEGVHGERRVVTVLFADLSGFTSYSERTDIEDVHALADETAERLGEIVERYGGYVDKVIGDCVMAVFGAPTSNEDDPRRGVCAALDMQAYVTEHTDRFARLPLTIGLNTGEAVWAPVGPGGRHTVLGDTVNTAARLQSAASKGEILIGDATAKALPDDVEVQEVDPIRAKNKEEPVRAWKAVALKGAETTRRAPRARLWGRHAELARLREIWELARIEQRPYLATLVGPTGIGKTRLIDELTATAGPDTVVLRGRCLPYGEGITYWPIVEIIKTSAGIHHDDDETAVSEKLGALLEGLGSSDADELRTMAVALAHLIGAPTTPRGTYTATEISQGELHWGLRRLLELVSRNSETVLVLEDLHCAEPTLLELIAFILDSSESVGILAVAAGRPEFQTSEDDIIGSRPNHRVIELAALADDDARGLLGELLAGRLVAEPAVTRLLKAAGGNPLFLEETAKSWFEASGNDAQLDDTPIPDSILGLITARLDRLSPDEARLIARASVIGNVFWSGAVRHLVGGDDGDDRLLAALERRDLVRRRRESAVTDEHEFEFRHGLIRDAAYSRLAKAERVVLHERFADWLADLSRSDDELAELVAYHLEQSCLLAREVSKAAHPAPRLKAVVALQKAAQKAESHEGVREAHRFYERALDVAGDGLPEAELDLRLRRARMASALGERDRASSDLEEVAGRAREIGRDDLACRAAINLADIRLTLGQVSEARAALDQADSLAQSLADNRQLVRVAFVRSVFLSLVDGDASNAVAVLREAIELAEEADDHELRLAGHLRLGTLFYNIGELGEAEAHLERTAKLAAEQGSLLYQAVASRVLATIGFQRGPRDESERLAEQVRVWLERIGDQLMCGEVNQLLAQFALARSDVDSAKANLREALRCAVGSTGTQVDIHRYLAEAHWRERRPSLARREAMAARSAAPDEDPAAQAMALVAEAFASAAAEEPVATRAAFDRAIELLDEEGLVTDAAEARTAYGRVLAVMDDVIGARGALESARDAFEAMGATAAVEDVERELMQLAT